MSTNGHVNANKSRYPRTFRVVVLIRKVYMEIRPIAHDLVSLPCVLHAVRLVLFLAAFVVRVSAV